MEGRNSTTELLPQKQLHFSPDFHDCQRGVPASSKNPPAPQDDLTSLLDGYRFCARAEGKSGKTIEMVVSSVTYLRRYLQSIGKPTTINDVGVAELRGFINYLQTRRRYVGHPFVSPRQSGLSDDTVNCYVRAIRSFWSWLLRETVVEQTPFSRIIIPRAAGKVIRTFSVAQMEDMLRAVNTSTPEGYRDYAILLLLMDTGIRVGELIGLRLGEIQLEDKTLRVKGKGNKERMVPFGRGVQRVLWQYINRFRAEPSPLKNDFVFLTVDGRPLTKNRIEFRIKKYGLKAGITGVRCSPHTLRHTAAINFLRNGGNVFSLQRLLGHSSLEMTRRYCELADVDVRNAHAAASPVDNLIHILPGRRSGTSQSINTAR